MIWYLTRPFFNNYKFWPPEEVIVGGQLLLGCNNILLQNRILQMKSNQTLNFTLYLVSTDLDIFESILEKRSNRRSNICVFVGTRFICLLKVLKIIWSFWNEWVGNFPILKFMDLRSQIVFLIRIDDDIKMLHAKFQPSMTIFSTKCSLYKMFCL